MAATPAPTWYAPYVTKFHTKVRTNLRMLQARSKKPDVTHPVFKPLPKLVCANCGIGKHPAPSAEYPAAQIAAVNYCVECDKTLCNFCTFLLHHPTTNFEQHSIEHIDKGNIGQQIVTPVLLDLFVISLCLFIWFGTKGISESYFTGSSYCPGVGKLRGTLLRYDANLFFYVKGQISTFCDLEDSYWRFFMDMWIRGILTGTDTWLLLFTQFMTAGVIEACVVGVIGYPAGVFYGLLANAIRLIEVEIQRYYAGNPPEHVKRVQETLKIFNFFSTKKLSTGKKLPPPTFRRKRNDTNWSEGFWYHYKRITRSFVYFQTQGSDAIRYVARMTLWGCFAVRVSCLLFARPVFYGGLGVGMQILGMGDLNKEYKTWLEVNMGVRPNSSFGVSDWLFHTFATPLMGNVSSAIQGGTLRQIAYVMIQASIQFAWAIKFYLIMGYLVRRAYLYVTTYKKTFLAAQAKAFDAKWLATERQEIWGKAWREPKMACDGYDSKDFVPFDKGTFFDQDKSFFRQRFSGAGTAGS